MSFGSAVKIKKKKTSITGTHASVHAHEFFHSISESEMIHTKRLSYHIEMKCENSFHAKHLNCEPC